MNQVKVVWMSDKKKEQFLRRSRRGRRGVIVEETCRGSRVCGVFSCRRMRRKWEGLW